MPAKAASVNQPILSCPVRNDDDRREQRTEGAPRISSHLKERLRQTMLAARSQTRHPRSLGMENCRSHADESGGNQEQSIAARKRQQNETKKRHAHARG